MRDRMRADLKAAMKARDRATVTVLRSALAAIENAEARPVETPPAGGPVAGAAVGVGSTERERRLHSEADVRAVVANEIHEHTTAAAEYEELGRPDLAGPLRLSARVLSGYLS